MTGLVAIYGKADLEIAVKSGSGLALPSSGLTPEQILRHRHTTGPILWVFKNIRQLPGNRLINGFCKLWEIDLSEFPEWANWEKLIPVAQDFNQ